MELKNTRNIMKGMEDKNQQADHLFKWMPTKY